MPWGAARLSSPRPGAGFLPGFRPGEAGFPRSTLCGCLSGRPRGSRSISYGKFNRPTGANSGRSGNWRYVPIIRDQWTSAKAASNQKLPVTSYQERPGNKRSSLEPRRLINRRRAVRGPCAAEDYPTSRARVHGGHCLSAGPVYGVQNLYRRICQYRRRLSWYLVDLQMNSGDNAENVPAHAFAVNSPCCTSSISVVIPQGRP